MTETKEKEKQPEKQKEPKVEYAEQGEPKPPQRFLELEKRVTALERKLGRVAP